MNRNKKTTIISLYESHEWQEQATLYQRQKIKTSSSKLSKYFRILAHCFAITSGTDLCLMFKSVFSVRLLDLCLHYISVMLTMGKSQNIHKIHFDWVKKITIFLSINQTLHVIKNSQFYLWIPCYFKTLYQGQY